jgi:hypothetical protein
MKKFALFVLLVSGVLIVFSGCGKNSNENANNTTPADTSGALNQAPSGTAETKQPARQEETKATQTEKPKEVKKVEPEFVKLTIPDSTELAVTLSDTVQTNANQVGDQFTGVLAAPVEIGGKTAIPQGSKVNLVITQLVKGGTLKTSPEIGFTIKEIVLPGGKTLSVATSEVYKKGRSHTAREAGMIGGGAAAGALVGALAGKGKGAAIGAAVGAAAGTGAAAATGRENLKYVPGDAVSFVVTQPVTVSVPRK